MKNKIVILLCLILFIVSVACVSAAEDANQTLTSDADDLISSEDTLIVSQSDDELIVGAGNGTFTQLQQKIDNAAAKSTIKLDKDYVYDSGFSTNGITINKELTINGNGHVIDALGQSRIFYVDSPTITLKDITFKNGKSDYWQRAGAIYFAQDVYDSKISGTFINNSGHDGGAIAFVNGVYNSDVSGTFINNYARDYDGGAIHFGTNVANSSVSGTFTNNRANDDGGAIYFSAESLNVSVSGTFTNNSANYGGGICVSRFSNSNVSGTFTNNYAQYGGGAIYLSNGIYNSCIFGTFINNTVADGSGGAMIFWGDVYNTTISGTFIDNSASDGGSALLFTYYDCSYSKVINSAFISNGIDTWGSYPIIDMNWFGNNAYNYDSRPYLNHESWFFLDGHSSPVTGASGKYTVVFDLNNLYNSSSKVVTHPDAPDFSDIVLELSASNGYLNKNSAKLGETVTFTSTVNKDGVVTATAGDYSFSIPIVNLNVDAPDVNKYYNGVERFVVTLTDNSNNPVANTEVSVTVDGKTTEGLSDGNGQFSIPLNLNPGVYTVTTNTKGLRVFSTVNVYSTVISEDITGIYKKTRFEATILDSTGRPVNNTEIKFNIAGQELYGTTNSKGVVRVAVNVDVDDYQITTTNPVTGQIKTNNIAITKANSTIKVSARTFENGVTLTSNISPRGLVGDVEFIINGNAHYTEAVNNSKASITLINLVSGTYDVVAHYSGDNNYFESSNTTTFKINKVVPKINVTADDISFGETLVVNVALPSDVEYRVNVTVGGMSKMVSLSGGVGSATFKGLDIGTYTVVATYGGDIKYAKASARTSVKVNKLVPNISISSKSVNYGEDLVVNVTLPSDVQYRVNVAVGEMSKMVTLTNGKGTTSFKGLAAGSYDIVATYGGDAKYMVGSANKTVKVKRISADIDIIADDILLGEDLVVDLVLPSDVQYRVNVTLAGMSKMVSLKDGEGSTTFKGLGVGTYTIVATYGGDNNYVKSTARTSVKVNKLLADISISAKNIDYGEDLVVDVTLPSDVQYRVNVTVGGMSKMVTLTDGKGSATFKGLSAGTYSISAVYAGDAKYTKSTASKTVKVNKILPTIVASAKTITYGEDLVVSLKASSDLTRRVSITIDGETKLVSLTNGKGSATFKGITAGTHTVAISYDGDDNYLKSTGSIVATVNKATPTIAITANDISYGQSLRVSVKLPSDVTQPCNAIIGAELKSVSLNKGAGAVNFNGLYGGYHIVNVFYNGDSNYNSAFNYCMVFVNPN